jgi:transposase
MNNIMDTMATDKKRTRRNYAPALKAQILAECELPGASVARIAMAHGINDNVVHTWRKLAREGLLSSPGVAVGFIPFTVAPEPDAEVGRVDHLVVEVQRGSLLMKFTWPLSAAEKLSAWTRELLR